MNLEFLVAAMPPPVSPVEAPRSEDWPAVESRLGAALPEDYKEFIEKYGTGKINDFLWVFNPFAKNENLNLFSQIEIQYEVLNELRSSGERIPYDYFPMAGGLLPFGMSANGDVFFWRTSSSAEQWTVAVNEGRSPSWEVFDVPMVQFLFETLSKKRSSGILPLGFVVAPPKFESA
jgi:hypothetical protein